MKAKSDKKESRPIEKPEMGQFKNSALRVGQQLKQSMPGLKPSVTVCEQAVSGNLDTACV
jgi:hypothetical protein